MRILLISLVLFTEFAVGQTAPVEIAFRIPEKDLIPEGITYHATSQTFFVSSIFKNKIVSISKGRKITDFISSNQDGIGQVLGLKVKDNQLWACSNTGENNPQGNSMVHVFDVTSGKLLRSWIFKANGETHLFNDLALTENGAFITDSDYGAIYRVHETLETPELWIKDEQLRYANGIASLPNGEIVVNAVNGFVKIDRNKNLRTLPFGNYQPICIDGLSYVNQSLVGIQNVVFPVSINQYFLNSSWDSILSAKVLTYDQPQWDIPTTGVVVDSLFYFIANSQLRNLEHTKIKDPSKLKEVLIMRVKIN